jgi:hypothetical protein
MKNLIRRIMLYILIIVILSFIEAILLTILGRYIFKVISGTQSFFQYVGFYSILTFVIQILGGFWLVYLLVNIFLKRNVNIILLSVVAGVLTCCIVKIITILGFETYYFEPFKHKYQILSFFFIGFFYPAISVYFTRKFLEKSI